MFCHNCGLEIPDKISFCPKCGTKLSDYSEVSRGEADNENKDILDDGSLNKDIQKESTESPRVLIGEKQNDKYVYLCTKCDTPVSASSDNGNYHCRKCGSKVIPLHVTKTEWEGMDKEARKQIVLDNPDLREDYKGKWKISPVLKVIGGIIVLFVAIFCIKGLLGCYDTAIAYKAYDQMFPFGWLTITNENTQIPSSSSAGSSKTSKGIFDDENVLLVKSGHPENYPDITYGEAFEVFFGNPTWKSFIGTQEGPDEDGDGEPDYSINDVDVVEFTGDCFYQDVEVKALVQFSLDKEQGTFTAEYLSFNDVPQSKLMLISLIASAFEDYQNDYMQSGATDTNG